MTIGINDASKLGFGCMRLPLTDPKDVTAIDIEQVKEMVDLFIQAGGTYFDTAFVYHNGCSETALREALVQRHEMPGMGAARRRNRQGMPGYVA